MTDNVEINKSLFNEAGRYIIVTAMRNEINTVETTIRSVLSQTEPPKAWIILDDGSTDGSTDIVNNYAIQYPWIISIALPDRGFDLVGKGVADLLNYGFNLIADIDVEFVSKLDADLYLAQGYFEYLLAEMDNNPLLGIISGHPYIMKNGRKVFERHSSYFPSGTARLYRYRFLQEIGPFVSSLGWDTVDILRMRIRGYTTKVSTTLYVHHIRPMGTRQGHFDGMTRDGRNNYITGYYRLFFLLRALYSARYFPFIVRTVCMLYGYARAERLKLPLAVSDEEHLYHINLQRNRLGLRSREKL